MSAIMDIISGLVVGGLILVIALTALGTGMQTTVNHSALEIVQLNLAQSHRIMESDLRKAGFGIPRQDQGQVFQVAAPSQVKILAHLNLLPGSEIPVAGVSTYDGIPDTLEYSITADETITLGDTTLTLYNINRRLKIASIASDSMMIGKIGNNDVFTYLDQWGRTTAVPAEIRMVEVSLRAFNPQVILSPELVMTGTLSSNDLEARRREVLRLLHGSYSREARIILRNLRR